MSPLWTVFNFGRRKRRDNYPAIISLSFRTKTLKDVVFRESIACEITIVTERGFYANIACQKIILLSLFEGNSVRVFRLIEHSAPFHVIFK